MSSNYDANVTVSTLEEIENSLNAINRNLLDATQCMTDSINEAGSFLSGLQFEKAKSETAKCISVTISTGRNIESAVMYLEAIKQLMEEYDRCRFQE